jgi:hypothetical protein
MSKVNASTKFHLTSLIESTLGLILFGAITCTRLNLDKCVELNQ